MAIYETSIEADNDLAEIWLYISDHSSDETADRFMGKLEHVFEKISKAPKIGRMQNDLYEGLRRHLYGNYSIYYDIVGDNHIIVRRIWHQSRDLENFSTQ